MADRLYRMRRSSLRMPNHDYCADGAAFVTICTQDRTAHFGAVSEVRMRLTEAGARVEALWQRSFHDHIIRSQADLNAICSDIENNPAQWAADNLFTM